MKKFGLVLGLALVVGVLVLPQVGQAGLLQPGDCRREWGINCSNTGSFADLVTMVIDVILSVAGLIAVLFVIIGGFQYIMSGANEELAEKGKKTLQNAVIGVVIIILSFVIVRVISDTLSWPWSS